MKKNQKITKKTIHQERNQNLMKLLCIYFIFFLSTIVFCTKTPVISFCEGIDKAGKGVHCGKKFSTGDLTVVVNSEKFETDSLKIIIFKKTNHKNEKIKESIHSIAHEDTHTTIPLSFYIEGEYLVEVRGKENKLLGAEWIHIIDIY